jgi:hypothetical protein
MQCSAPDKLSPDAIEENLGLAILVAFDVLGDEGDKFLDLGGVALHGQFVPDPGENATIAPCYRRSTPFRIVRLDGFQTVRNVVAIGLWPGTVAYASGSWGASSSGAVCQYRLMGCVRNAQVLHASLPSQNASSVAMHFRPFLASTSASLRPRQRAIAPVVRENLGAWTRWPQKTQRFLAIPGAQS